MFCRVLYSCIILLLCIDITRCHIAGVPLTLAPSFIFVWGSGDGYLQSRRYLIAIWLASVRDLVTHTRETGTLALAFLR